MTKLKPLKAGEQPDPALFRLMADTVQDYAIFLLDTAGRVATWNSGARAIKQYDEKEIIGKHFSLFYTEPDTQRDWPARELKLALETGRFEDEGWRVRKDGTRFWANVIITPLLDDSGTLLAYSKITRDLTGRRLYEEKLKHSEERFRLLVEGVRDYAIYMLDVNGLVTSWNAGARHITGYESQEVIGEHFSRFFPADDVVDGKPDAELAMARMHGRVEGEGWRQRKNGSRFWARAVVTALYDSKGALRGFAKVTQDLTHQKHAEALETSRNNINEFIAILAHELRNPLAPIRSAVHLMMAADEGDNTNAHIVRIIDRQSSQLMRIVDDILDVSRVTRGLLEVSKNPVSVANLLVRAIEAARPGIDLEGHTLIMKTDDAPATIIGDEVRLAQAITNILNNACRYTPRGGTITLEVTTAGEAPHQQCVISIKDNGRGIDPVFINSIFGLFVQGTDAHKPQSTGLGVGLALAKSIVELHEGSVTAVSEGVGKGSEFVVRIPVAVQPAPTVFPSAGTTPVQPLRILVVDDNEDAAVLLTSYLRTLGHEVVTVYNAAEALRAFESKPFQLVLLDIGMPGMNGLQLARLLRVLPNGINAYVVAISGWGKPEDHVRSSEAGIDLHLVKPVEADDLASVLRHCASRVQRERDGNAGNHVRAENDAPAPLHVLVVDDNVDSARTTGWLLETMGHRFTLAFDGRNAISSARELLPDVILLDIGLPDIDGFEVCKQLRNNPQLSSTRIVAQTGRDKQSDREMAKAAGFNHHIVKPLNIEALAAVLRMSRTQTPH